MSFFSDFMSIFKSQNEFEKCLQKSKLFQNNFEILDTTVFDLIKVFLEGKSQNIPLDQAQKIFFNQIEKCEMTWNIKIKVLTTIHKFILELGAQFADEMLNYKLNSIKSKKPSQDQKKKHVIFHHIDMVQWVEDNIINFYYNYLQKLAINYQIYRICIEDGELPSSEDFKLDYKLKFMWLFKISNIFNYIVKIQKSLKIVFSDFDSKTTLIIKEVGLLILHDLVSMYDVMSKEIMYLVDRLQLLTTTDAIQFYEMYKEVQIMGEQLQDFVKLKNHFDIHDLIPNPHWFRITNEQKKEIDNYNKKIQLLFSSAVRIKREIRLQTEEEQNLQHYAQMGLNNPEKPKTPPPQAVQSTFSFSKQIKMSNNNRSKSAFQGEEKKIQPFYYNDDENNQDNNNQYKDEQNNIEEDEKEDAEEQDNYMFYKQDNQDQDEEQFQQYKEADIQKPEVMAPNEEQSEQQQQQQLQENEIIENKDQNQNQGDQQKNEIKRQDQEKLNEINNQDNQQNQNIENQNELKEQHEQQIDINNNLEQQNEIKDQDQKENVINDQVEKQNEINQVQLNEESNGNQNMHKVDQKEEISNENQDKNNVDQKQELIINNDIQNQNQQNDQIIKESQEHNNNENKDLQIQNDNNNNINNDQQENIQNNENEKLQQQQKNEGENQISNQDNNEQIIQQQQKE